MAKQRIQKIDARELPTYTIAEAAHYLGVPPATIRYWATGQDSYAALIDVPDSQPTLLSFLNLVEFHVLAVCRRYRPRWQDFHLPSLTARITR